MTNPEASLLKPEILIAMGHLNEAPPLGLDKEGTAEALGFDDIKYDFRTRLTSSRNFALSNSSAQTGGGMGWWRFEARGRPSAGATEGLRDEHWLGFRKGKQVLCAGVTCERHA